MEELWAEKKGQAQPCRGPRVVGGDQGKRETVDGGAEMRKLDWVALCSWNAEDGLSVAASTGDGRMAGWR